MKRLVDESSDSKNTALLLIYAISENFEELWTDEEEGEKRLL